MEADMQWFCLNVRPQQEFIARQIFEDKDRLYDWRAQEVYLPLVNERRAWGRKRVIDWRAYPMYTGYLFVKISPFEKEQLFRWRFAMSLVKKPGSEGEAYLFKPDMIANIRLAELKENKGHIAPPVEWFPTIGQWTEIQKGPYDIAGAKCVVEELYGKNKDKAHKFWTTIRGKRFLIEAQNVLPVEAA
jgi:hypothetical protein